MEQATPMESDQPTVQQMFATLLGEIATLRRQNEDQQRQLEHLQSTTSLLLERHNVPPQALGKLQFKHLPLEVREMIWELAIPCRLLRFEGVEEETSASVPVAMPIPAVASVCRESRRVFAARKQPTKPWETCASYHHPEAATHLWRLKHESLTCWTSFRPRTDALLINPEDFLVEDWLINYSIPRVAEHVVIDSFPVWGQFLDGNFDDGHEGVLYDWVRQPKSKPLTYYPRTVTPTSQWTPFCHLRTIDFAISRVTEVDRNYPANLVHHLFHGDSVKAVDLRSEEAVNTIERMINTEISQVVERTEHLSLPTDLHYSLEFYKKNVAGLFPRIRSLLLEVLVESYYHWAYYHDPNTILPSPFRDGKLDMEVTWVNDLCKRIDVRPVHVFIRSEGISHVNW